MEKSGADGWMELINELSKYNSELRRVLPEVPHRPPLQLLDKQHFLSSDSGRESPFPTAEQ
jgi:hypothetical protein